MGLLEQVPDFSDENACEILDPNAQPLNRIIMGCSAMITDYSSAVWDVIYQDKPAIFFQFDRSLHLEKTGSYIDFDTELPGPCYHDAKGLVEGLRQVIESGFVTSDEHRELAARWYAHRDQNNCRRIYECARAIEQAL